MLDLTGDTIRLTTPANDVVIEHFTINPLFSGTILANYLNNPLFVGTKDATGLLTVTFKSCDRLPLGDLVKKTTADNDGSVHAVVDIAALHLGIANDTVKDALKGNSVEGSVNGATVDVARGVMTEHFPIGSSAYVITLDGNARLSDQAMKMTLLFPLNWVAKTHLTQDKDIIAAVPETFPIGVSGTLNRANFAFSQLGGVLKNAFAKGGQKALQDKLLKGKKPEDALGDLLNQATKKKK